jgi:hypothetical protein
MEGGDTGHREAFALFGNRLPERLRKQFEEFKKRLG